MREQTESLSPSSLDKEGMFTAFEDQSYWPELESLDIPGSTEMSQSVITPSNSDSGIVIGDTVDKEENDVAASTSPSRGLNPGEAIAEADICRCGCVTEVLQAQIRGWDLCLQPPSGGNHHYSHSGVTQIRFAVDACERLILCSQPHNAVYVLLLLLAAFQKIDDYLNALVTASKTAGRPPIDRKEILRAIMVFSALDFPEQFSSWTGSGVPEQMAHLKGFINQLQQRLRERLEQV